MGVAALVIFAVAYALVRSVTLPLARLKGAMAAVADEDMAVAISDTDRRDEIGEMANVLTVLRNSVSDRSDLKDRESEQQWQIAEERRGNERSLQAASDRQRPSRRSDNAWNGWPQAISPSLSARLAKSTPSFARISTRQSTPWQV